MVTNYGQRWIQVGKKVVHSVSRFSGRFVFVRSIVAPSWTLPKRSIRSEKGGGAEWFWRHDTRRYNGWCGPKLSHFLVLICYLSAAHTAHPVTARGVETTTKKQLKIVTKWPQYSNNCLYLWEVVFVVFKLPCVHRGLRALVYLRIHCRNGCFTTHCTQLCLLHFFNVDLNYVFCVESLFRPDPVPLVIIAAPASITFLHGTWGNGGRFSPQITQLYFK